MKETLYENGVLNVADIPSSNFEHLESQSSPSNMSLNFEEQMEILRLQMQLEKEKGLTLEGLLQQVAFNLTSALDKMSQQTVKISLEIERLKLIK